MSTRSGIIALSAVALILGSGSTWADTKSVQGTVIGVDGKPLAGADVRAERLDAKAQPALTKTDSKGQYQFKGLPVGAYAITTIVKEVPKSRASVRTRADGWAKVDFDLRLKPGDSSIKRNWVWVKGEPGSHIGGRWVPVDQANKPTTSAIDTVGSDDVDRIQRDVKMGTSGAMPGR